MYLCRKFRNIAGTFTGLVKVNECVIDSIWYSSSAIDQGYPGIDYKDGEVILSYYRAEVSVGYIFLK